MSATEPLHQSASPTNRNRTALRWAAPVAVAAIAIGGGLSANVTASAEPALPPKTPEQLVAAVSNAEVDGLSGTVTTTSNLGLPVLRLGSIKPSKGESERGAPTDEEFAEMLAGTHTLRVWTAGDDRSRVALLGDGDESSVIRNGDEAWAWSSDKQAVQHSTYTGKATKDAAKSSPTPEDAAQRALDEIGPTSRIDVARNVSVAGRPAYELVLSPKDERSLLTEVTIAVDSETSVPLRVETAADGQTDPVFSVGFTPVDFSVPPAETFEFTPPAGAKITERTIPAEQKEESDAPADETKVGDGWTSVVITDLSKLDDKSRRQLNQTIGTLPEVSGEWGSGRLLSGTAFSAVITDDGRVAYGLVGPELLYTALGK